MAARTPTATPAPIELGYDMVRQELLAKIRDMIALADAGRPAAAPSQAAEP